jgi:hypothetical protein
MHYVVRTFVPGPVPGTVASDRTCITEPSTDLGACIKRARQLALAWTYVELRKVTKKGHDLIYSWSGGQVSYSSPDLPSLSAALRAVEQDVVL